MAKMIKFDLLIDGAKVKTFEELQDNLHADLLTYVKNGKLAKWFLSRDMADKAEATQGIDSNQTDLALMMAVCEVLELEADEAILTDILAMPVQLAQAQQARTADAAAETQEEEDDTPPAPTYRIDWSGKDMSGRHFDGEDLSNANFEGTNFSNASFIDANLTGAKLKGANLSGAKLDGADLSNANLEGAILNEASFSSYSSVGGLFANLGNLLNGGKCADLSNSNLTGVEGDNVTFSRCNMTACNLTKAQLTNTAFCGADLTDANLSEATLTECDFHGVHRHDKEYHKTILVRTDFSFADVTGSNLMKKYSSWDYDSWIVEDVKLTGAVGYRK